jgi:hypothetical protein
MTAAAAVVSLTIVAHALSGLPLVVTARTTGLEGTSASAASASLMATADESGREPRLAPEEPDSSPRSRRTTYRLGARRPPAHGSPIDLAASSRLESDSPMETGPGPEPTPVANRASLPTSLPVALIPLVELSTVPGATSVYATGGNPSLEERSEGHRSAGLQPRVSAPWDLAAGAGLAVGRGSKTAAAATAGFFTRFGKRIAGRF